MWKKLLGTVLFFTIFSLLFLGITPLFVPKDNGDYEGIYELEAKGFLGEPENTMDVLFLGDSETFSAFIPLKLWEDYGITSYLCSTADQAMYQSEAYLKRFFRTQSPKMVILETNALYRTFTLTEMVGYELEERLPYLRYHDRWKSLNPEDWTNEVNFTHQLRDKGYAYRTAYAEPDLTDYMAPSEEAAAIPWLCRQFARKIEGFCRERGVRLVLVSTPSPVNWNSYKHNGVALLAQELDVPYIDMNLMPQEVPIDWSMDSYDGGDHLNYTGACKATAYMGGYLWDTGLFTDKRQEPEYSRWHGWAEDFRREREAQQG